MAKSNLLRKSEVLNNGDYENFRFVQQMCNSAYRNIPISENNPFASPQDAIDYDAWKRQNDSDNWKECERLDHARCERVSRLRSKVTYMVGKYTCNFTTLTFTDEVMSSTSSRTRHEYVKRWLRNFPCAIANVDYGGKFGREHYHAIVPVAKVSHSTWKYGRIYGKTIRNDDGSIDKVSRYTAKLVNHAIKETTKGCRTIYSGYFGLPKPIDHVKGHSDDESLAFSRLNRKLIVQSEIDYDDMLSHGDLRQFYVPKDKNISDTQKINSEGFEWLTDERQAELDAIFLN